MNQTPPNRIRKHFTGKEIIECIEVQNASVAQGAGLLTLYLLTQILHYKHNS
jgi:hypothetical protein